RWPALQPGAKQLQILTPGELIPSLPQEEDQVTILLEAGRAPLREVIEQAHHADDRRRQDVALAGLVVEADVAADDWKLEGSAGIRQAPDTLLQLSKDRGPIGIAEVEAIGDGQRAGAGTGDVARRFRDRRPCAVVGIERDVPGVAIRRQRQ